MITLTVTSHSSLSELHVAERTVADLIKLAVGRDMEEPNLYVVNESKSNLFDAIDANDQTNRERFSKSELAEAAVFNPTELAEAEALGKPVCSTVDAEVSQTAHADTTVNTSIPTPQSVFGQAAQTVVSEVNHVAPVTEPPATDADGLVWDERIHSSSRELNKDGTWRKRRGVNTDLVTKVEAELRGVTSALIDNNLQAIPAKPLKSIDWVNPVPPVDVAVQSAPTNTDMTFPELLDGVTKAMVAGQLTQARINEALNSIGVQALPHLIARADLIPAFREALGGVV